MGPRRMSLTPCGTARIRTACSHVASPGYALSDRRPAVVPREPARPHDEQRWAAHAAEAGGCVRGAQLRFSHDERSRRAHGAGFGATAWHGVDSRAGGDGERAAPLAGECQVSGGSREDWQAAPQTDPGPGWLCHSKPSKLGPGLQPLSAVPARIVAGLRGRGNLQWRAPAR